MPELVKLVHCTPEAEHLITDMARVSAPSNQGNYDTAPRLIKYLIKHKHWSPFEMATMCVEINTTRDIAAQILRHKSFAFQEFCMAGSTEVYFDSPRALDSNKRAVSKLTLEHLYNNWVKNNYTRGRIKNMNVRIFDEKTKSLTHAHIKEVFKTGIKDIFEITLENGKIIRCTKEHKVLAQEGFVSLENAIGLSLNGNTATVSKNTFIGCNGALAYRSREWMAEAKLRNIANKRGLRGIAEDAGVSIHTAHKWIKIHGLSFTKKEVAIYCQPWNKGKFGYSTGVRTEETREKMRKAAKRGSDSNLWKGGTTSNRASIQADIAKYRRQLIQDFDGKCGLCGLALNGTIHLHHVVPVVDDISLAREYSNLMPVHADCHRNHHGINGDCKTWKERGRGNTLTVQWSKVKQVKYLGQQMTYDLEIDHNSHNYVADGVIVHNSQRYADVKDLGEIQVPELRRQDTKNRQNSVADLDPELVAAFEQRIKMLFAESQELYDDMLEAGVAKESARKVLPMNSPSRMYMSGTLRSWIHYIELRSANGTQKEHMDIANDIADIFAEQFPAIYQALEELKGEPEPQPQPYVVRIVPPQKEAPESVKPTRRQRIKAWFIKTFTQLRKDREF